MYANQRGVPQAINTAISLRIPDNSILIIWRDLHTYEQWIIIGDCIFYDIRCQISHDDYRVDGWVELISYLAFDKCLSGCIGMIY